MSVSWNKEEWWNESQNNREVLNWNRNSKRGNSRIEIRMRSGEIKTEIRRNGEIEIGIIRNGGIAIRIGRIVKFIKLKLKRGEIGMMRNGRMGMGIGGKNESRGAMVK